MLGLETDNANGASVTFFVNVAANPVSVGFPFSTVRFQVILFDVLYCELLTCCAVMITDPTFKMFTYATLPLLFISTIPKLFVEYSLEALLSLTVPSVKMESP